MQPHEIASDELYRLLEKESPFFLFDVRNVDEFEKWRIEGKGEFPVLNIPYFDLVEKGGKEDFEESIAHFVQTDLASKLPKEKKIVVVCAKGGTSALVADTLNKIGYKSLSLFGGMKGWNDFCKIKTIVESPGISIYQVIRVARGCLSYVVASGGEVTVIDPFRNLQPYLDLFKKLKVQPKFILDTHAHADHISGGKVLAKKFGVPYFLHPYDGIHPMDMLPATFSYEPSWPEKMYRLGKVEIKALHIPGHTLGNQAFYLDNKFLFSGDSIFISSIARPDLGGQAKTWTVLHYESLRRLLKLPDDTVVLPAHFSTLKEAGADNRFSRLLQDLKKENEGLIMAGKSLEEFSEYILKNLPEFPKQYIDIKRVNIGLLQPDEEQAEELEIGKNICAVNKGK